MRMTCLVAVLVLSLLAVPALADDPAAGAPISPNAQGLSDAELDRRIEWLEQTLDAGAGYSKLWQYGWSGGSLTAKARPPSVVSVVDNRLRSGVVR
ncbi:MAG: hypothetical protein IH884_09345 [Myxococcales bacterium]|nr:hypothetical protein [Myxococcales bacterium]